MDLVPSRSENALLDIGLWWEGNDAMKNTREVSIDAVAHQSGAGASSVTTGTFAYCSSGRLVQMKWIVVGCGWICGLGTECDRKSGNGRVKGDVASQR